VIKNQKMSIHTQCCPKDYSNLDLDYTFELIPDELAAAEAGYTKETRALAQVWYGPVVDGNYIYYAAYFGSTVGANNLSSIFVCRERSKGGLIYAVNCGAWNLDTSANFLGSKNVICRCRPVILGDVVYLCNALMSNIGPQLYAVNKRTGQLLWAAAYNTPGDLGYITEKGDYSAYVGSNMRISDLNPVAFYDKNGFANILIGVSSLQNVINVGVINGGYPKYTDQGALFCIKDEEFSSRLVWKTETCAPLLKKGDFILKGGDPKNDPFRPSENIVRLVSVSEPENYFINVYFLENAPQPGSANTTPILTNVFFNKTTVINARLVQPIWQSISTIYQDNNKSDFYTLNELLALWRNEQANLPENGSAKHQIWSYVTKSKIDEAKAQVGNNGIVFFKFMTSGSVIATDQDAQGLNYYGNSTWGYEPVVAEHETKVFFSTAQSHDSPLDEALFFAQPEYNFATLKYPLIDTITLYAEGLDTLFQVNVEKKRFTEKIRNLALDLSLKSPRGRMSYSDAIMATYHKIPAYENYGRNKPGSLIFGVRSVPFDNYSFLADVSPILPPGDIDGDASSGVFLFQKRGCSLVTTPTKGGIAPIVDYTNIDHRVVYNHENIQRKGAVFKKLVYNGPNGLLGGSNFGAASTETIMVSSQANMPWFGGNVGSTLQLEKFVKNNGDVVKINNSVLQTYNPSDGNIIWEADYDNRSYTQITYKNGNFFCNDLNGNLYIFDARSGVMTWKQNGKALGMNGGIASPAVTNDNQVFWCASYNAFGIGGGPSQYGAAFRINPKLNTVGLGLCSMLNKRTFISWDTAPKRNFENPAQNPVNAVLITHKWNTHGNKFLVEATHADLEAPFATNTYTFLVKEYNTAEQTVTFQKPAFLGSIVYEKLKFINAKKYVLYYTLPELDAPLQKAWLELEYVL
jgi:hypothetical protein